jgi:hypothetical protein
LHVRGRDFVLSTGRSEEIADDEDGNSDAKRDYPA